MIFALLLSGVQAGIQPGSKELGAIWFIGDSITQSNADGDNEGSPRKSLYDLLTANGYSFSYTGHHLRNEDGLPVTGTNGVDNLYHYHSGVSGILIGEATGKGMRGQLSHDWNSGRLAEVKPNVILIMIGTNDIGHKYDEENAPIRLRALVQEIYDLPGIGTPTIFLASIPPNRRTEAETANGIEFNAQVPCIVAEFQLLGKDIHFVDQFAALDSDYAANMRKDNLHPNAAGNEAMAQQWFNAISSVAAEKISFPGQKGEFRGTFDQYNFSTEKGDMIVLCPAKPATGNPWVWKGWFWGNKLIPSTQFTVLADVKLLEEGFYIVMAGGDSLGHPSGSERMNAAYELMTETYGFSRKPALVGLSRECLSVYRWASANPDRVGCIYVDNGVCSLKSWPGGRRVPGSDSKGEGNAKQWALMKERYGFASDDEALAYKGNPIDLLEPLAKAGIPVLHVCGLADDTVPYEENSAIVKERYEKLGGYYREILKKGMGHHPHGLEDPTPILDFINKHASP